MDVFDIYGDLELQLAQEKQKAVEDLQWKEKYEVALSTIQALQTEKKELNKKIKQLETNFASLFDTARAEIKRKDNQIWELRKQRDDICFRRSKPHPSGRNINYSADVQRNASSEDVYSYPFSREPRKPINSNTKLTEKLSDDELPSTSPIEQIEIDKRKLEKINYREHESRNTSREKDKKSDAHRERSKDRIRQRNRSKDRLDERSRHRFDDLYDRKQRNRSQDHKYQKSDERSHHKHDRKDEKRRKHCRERSQTRSSESSWDKTDNIRWHSPLANYVDEGTRYEPTKLEDPKDICKSSDNQKEQTKDLKTELDSSIEKKATHKIEILQIEILKDVKELKKNKLVAEKIKPEPIDPVKIATEKSNTFLDALFDDSIMNQPKTDMNDDLLVTTQKKDLLTDNNEKGNLRKTDENFNLNFQTPQRPPSTKFFGDIFGPSPSGSLSAEVGRQNYAQSAVEPNDSDFVPILKKGEQTKLPDKTISEECLKMKAPQNPVTKVVNQIDKTVTENLYDDMTMDFQQTDPNADNKKFTKTDENSNLKNQTPQKQPITNLMDDLFGPSPAVSVCRQKNSVTSMDESSSDFYFVPSMKPLSARTDEGSSKVPVVIDECSIDDVIKNIEERLEDKEAKKYVAPNLAQKDVTENIVNDHKSFKFVELDSSFYSSDDDINDINDDLKGNLKSSRPEIESPPYENLSITQSKHIQTSENESIGKPSASKLSTEKKNFEEMSNLLLNSDEKSRNEENPAAKCKDTSKNKTRGDDYKQNYKSSFAENQKQSKTSYHSSGRNKERQEKEISKKHDSKKHYNSSKDNKTSHNYNSRSSSEELRTSHHSSKRKREGQEIYRTDDSKEHHSNSSKHDRNSKNSEWNPSLEENLHRSSSSRIEKHKHHHHTHDYRSEKSTHTKNDSSHRLSHSSRKHSKNNKIHERIDRKNRSSKDRSDSRDLKNEVFAARSSPLLEYFDDDHHVKDFSKNEKNTDQDQVFFLHCDDITDDDEIIGGYSDSEEYKKTSNDDGRSKNGKNEEKQISSTRLSSTIKNKNEINKESEQSKISNEVESNKIDIASFDESNDKQMNSIISSKHENNAEINIDTESIVFSLEEEETQDKNLTFSNSSNPANVTSTIDENSSVDVCGNPAAVISDQKFSEDLEKTPEKENNFVNNSIQNQSNEYMLTETENVELKEQEKSEVLESASYKDDRILHEGLNNTDENVALNKKSSQEIQSMCSLEVGLEDQRKNESNEKVELLNSIHPSSHHFELNKRTNLPIIELSGSEENDVFVQQKDSFQEILNNEKPVSDEKLEACLEEHVHSDNSFGSQVEINQQVKPTYVEIPAQESITPNRKKCETYSHEITCDDLSKTSDTSPNEIVISPKTNGTQEMSSQITNNISVCSKSELEQLTANQNVSHSTKLPFSHVSSQKSLNSADDLESSHSNSDSASSGRRKKTKTPRKRTDAPKKFDEAHSLTSIEYKSDFTSCEVRSELHSADKDKKDVKGLSPSPQSEPEVLLGSENSNQNNALKLETKGQDQNFEKKQDYNDKKETEEELNDCLKSAKEVVTDKSPQEEQKPLDTNKQKSASEKIVNDLNKQKSENITSSPDLFMEFSQQIEKYCQYTEEPTPCLLKTKDTPPHFPPQSVFSTDQSDTNFQDVEDYLQISLTNEDQFEDAVETAEIVPCIESDKIEKLNIQIAKFVEIEVDTEAENEVEREKEVEKELEKKVDEDGAQKEVTSQTNYSVPSSESTEVKIKEDEKTESFSISIHRNRNNKKNRRYSTKDTETVSNEDVHGKHETLFPGESLEDQSHNLSIAQKKKINPSGVAKSKNNLDFVEKSSNEVGVACSSSFGNDNTSTISASTLKKTKRKGEQQSTKEHQMMKHFMDSDHILVGTCNYELLTYSDEALDTKPKEINVKKRNRKSNASLDKSDSEFKNDTTETSPPNCGSTTSHVKRKYKKKTTQIPDSSISNEGGNVTNSCIIEGANDNVKKSNAKNHINSTDLKEPRKKRKYTKKNLNSSSDSTSKSNEVGESLECPGKTSSFSRLKPASSVEKVLEKLDSPRQTGESVQEILCPSNEISDIGVIKSSSSFSEKALEECCDKNERAYSAIDVYLNNSVSGEEKEHDSCNIKHNKAKKQKKRKLSTSSDGKSEEVVVQTKRSKKILEDTSQSSIKTCDTTGKNYGDSIKQPDRSPSHEKSSFIELTPTHHKIFLNDVFPNDPPPVYNANDDDLQYHEIDDRLRSMFQSPAYTQQSNGECTLDTNPERNDNVMDDETLSQNEQAQYDTSTSSRKVSLGANEYVIESVGSHTANVFITRKKCKKRKKVVTNPT